MVENDTGCTNPGARADHCGEVAPDTGGLVLVTGDVPASVHRRISRGFLDGPLPSHRRILVLPAVGKEGVDAYLPARARRDRTHLQLVEIGADDAPADDGLAGDPEGIDPRLRAETVRCVGSDLGALGVAISELVSAVEASTDELVPGELQVVVDGLDGLVESVDDFALVKFTHLLKSRISTAGGVGYLHLHRPRTSKLVTQLSPVCSSQVSVRGSAENPEYRVYGSDGTVSEWHSLDCPPGEKAP